MASSITLQATYFLHMMKSSPFSTLTHSLSLSIPVRQAAEACKQWSTVLYWVLHKVLHKARRCTKRYYFCSSYLPVSAPVFIEHASMKGEKDTKTKRQHCGPPPVVLLSTHLLKENYTMCLFFNITVTCLLESSFHRLLLRCTLLQPVQSLKSFDAKPNLMQRTVQTPAASLNTRTTL